MTFYAGPRWRDGEPEDAWIQVESGRLADEGRGSCPGPAEPAVMLEGLSNLHAHVGDAFLRGKELPRDLADLVAPGSGYKHRMLRAATDETVEAGIRAQLAAFAAHGTAWVVDFREQGVEGIRLARRAAKSSPPVGLLLLGRPAGVPPEPSAADPLLAEADGLGLPSLTDYGRDACTALAEAAHRRGRPVALHVSEARREPIEDALGLEPDLLVHACAATPADLRRIADAGVPVAVCPTSNARFGLRPVADRLEALGASWFLGTDNAMLGGVDLLDEARALRRVAPDVPDEALLRALTTPPEKPIKRIGRLGERRAPPRRLVVVPTDDRGRVRWGARATRLEAAPHGNV